MLKIPAPYLTDPSGTEHPLQDEITHIGRDLANQVVVVSKRASREHASILRQGRRVYIEDHESTNGTLVNGERLLGQRLLGDGDRISIGDVTFEFHDPESTSIETPFPDLQLNPSAGEVRLNRQLLTLSPKEYNLLAYLFSRRGLVCSKEEISRAVWSEYQGGIFDYQVENLVRRLRTKIEPDPDHPQLLITLRGLGYRLNGKEMAEL